MTVAHSWPFRRSPEASAMPAAAIMAKGVESCRKPERQDSQGTWGMRKIEQRGHISSYDLARFFSREGNCSSLNVVVDFTQLN
jgi:hypothetical protein